MPQHRRQSRMVRWFEAFALHLGWNQLDIVYYEMLKTNETITGDRYGLQSMRLSKH